MFKLLFLLSSVSLIGGILGACPSGGEIYFIGVTAQSAVDVLNAHNFYRNQISNGLVAGQPKGKNILTMVYDMTLSVEARPVTSSCQPNHILANDPRWKYVGQNIYATWSTQFSTNQNWTEAVNAWFSEKNNFVYPNTSHGVTGHYTQVVWATSSNLGCDFIAFFDTTKPQYPYGKIYVCNYGPGGNIIGQPPYQLA